MGDRMDDRRVILVIIVTLLCVQIIAAQVSFSWRACLDAHNSLRESHKDTPVLRYSSDLQQSAQRYADRLARSDNWKHDPRPTRDPPKRRAIPDVTTPFVHKETWDGEIYFPLSGTDLNRGTKIPVGESIHKFCCYSWPYCPKEFFNDVDFPPSASSVVNSWYNEINSYDFDGGVSKDGEPISHFTNIVWRDSKELGCAQSRKSPRGCIYTVARYRVQGSLGAVEDYRINVQTLGARASSGSSSESVILTVFLVLLMLLLLAAALVLVYLKRQFIRGSYSSFMKRRRNANTEASLDGNDGMLSRFRKPKKNIIYKPRPTSTALQRGAPLRASDIVHQSAPSRKATLEPRDPTSHDNAVAFDMPVVKGRQQEQARRPRLASKLSQEEPPPRPKVPPVAFMHNTNAAKPDRPPVKPLPQRPISLGNLQAPPKPLPRKPSDLSARPRPARELESPSDTAAVATLRAELKKLAAKPQVKPRSNTVAIVTTPDNGSPQTHRPDKERSNTTVTDNDGKEKAIENLKTELEKLTGRSAPNTPKETRVAKGSNAAPSLKPQPAKRPDAARLSRNDPGKNSDAADNLALPIGRKPLTEQRSLNIDSPSRMTSDHLPSKDRSDSAPDSHSPLLRKRSNEDDADGDSSTQPSVSEMRRLLANKGCR